MTDKKSKENEPEPFEPPENEIIDAEALLPHKGPIITKSLEHRPMKESKPTVDVLSNDGDTAILARSNNPTDTFTYKRSETGLSADSFLKLYPKGAKGREAPPKEL